MSSPQASPSPVRDRLLAVQAGIDRRLDRHNPGERLSWWIAPDAFELPARTTEALARGGPALDRFFRVANEIFHEEPWVRRRIEKTWTPLYARLNRAQPDALPKLLRPDVVLGPDWLPKLVELEITVGCRGDTGVMAEEYGLDPSKGLVRAYAEMIRRLELGDGPLALVTAPHPFFADLPDDARAFASMLRAEGVDVVVLGEENLGHLWFDGETLWLGRIDGPPRPLRWIDRLIDIYEIAELQHPGMGAICDALLAGKVRDVNTCKQFLDEKDWMSLFWDPRLRARWEAGLGEDDAVLRSLVPRTWIVGPETNVVLASGETVPILRLADLPPEERAFVVKESGTSTTASAAQSFQPLGELDRDATAKLLGELVCSDVPWVIQEIVDSPRIGFTALDPDTGRVVVQQGARIKLSVFYVEGRMTDVRFIASNVKLAVNDVDCVVGVVRHSEDTWNG